VVLLSHFKIIFRSELL